MSELFHDLTCCYVFSCVPYVPDPENTNLLKTALSIYQKFNQYAEATFVAIQLGDVDLVKQIFMSCSDR